ncbi:hypothetical protein A2U01_0108418 [Trifolium medium]|uniref:Uncharacterized protein n=1 Tax=Trifolium medium TaxID=97028 RepID=A0A392VGV9_9FABA|nr:hypothetical protein [Trifolium medium]
MYQLHLQGPVMTPQDFQAHSNWPGDRSHFGEGMGADDDEADEAAANVFVDEEDDASD